MSFEIVSKPDFLLYCFMLIEHFSKSFSCGFSCFCFFQNPKIRCERECFWHWVARLVAPISVKSNMQFFRTIFKVQTPVGGVTQVSFQPPAKNFLSPKLQPSTFPWHSDWGWGGVGVIQVFFHLPGKNVPSPKLQPLTFPWHSDRGEGSHRFLSQGVTQVSFSGGHTGFFFRGSHRFLSQGITQAQGGGVIQVLSSGQPNFSMK